MVGEERSFVEIYRHASPVNGGPQQTQIVELREKIPIIRCILAFIHFNLSCLWRTQASSKVSESCFP